jgi:hypothetical protein
VCEGLPTDLSCVAARPGVTYEWDFDDDGTFDFTGCEGTHTYPAPGVTARLRATSAGGCVAETTVAVTLEADQPVAGAVVIHGVKLRPDGLQFEWAPVAGAVSYRVARGTIGSFPDHQIDEGSGIGACDTLALTDWADPDDLFEAGNFYYLVAPLSNCGSDGPWGLPAAPVPPPSPSTCP